MTSLIFDKTNIVNPGHSGNEAVEFVRALPSDPNQATLRIRQGSKGNNYLSPSIVSG